jgi:prepilin-type N-terminal cleavage/methylation domain-containing protein
MLKQLQKKKSEGFTIIEVLIVLAIAGLILLIVFLAVPALQRNSRNTSIKNDAQNVLGGVSEYFGANSGSVPTAISGTGTINYTGGTGTNPTSIKVQGSTVVTQITTDPTATVASGTIQVYIGRKCATNSTSTASSRSVAVFYSIETSSTTVPQCADS